MTARGLATFVWCLALAVGTGVRWAPMQAQQAPVFRTTTESVAVDVSVMEGGRALRGLSAGDFRVADNRVVQIVESLDALAMPIDVTLVADVSGRTRGMWTSGASPADTVRQVNRELAAMAALLRPDDRIALLASDTSVQQILPMQSPGTVTAREINTQGLSSIYDAIAAALLRPVEANRRHLVVAWTKAIDTISTNDATTLREIAQRADAVLHIVERDAELRPGLAISPGGTPLNQTPMNLVETQVRSWRPYLRNDPALLPELAALTGGTVHSYGGLRDPNPAEEFRAIFDEFRQGYVLRYTPRRVDREGWHEIVVAVPTRPNAEIRARRGYAVERATPLARAQPATALDGFIAAYDRGDPGAVPPALRQSGDIGRLIRLFREAGNPWPASPRTEALFALDLITAGVASQDRATREIAVDLVGEYVALVRAPIPGDAFECAWYGAVVGALEGARQTDAISNLLPRLLARCPADARLQLARAFVADLELQIQASERGGREMLFATEAGSILRLYDEAAMFDDVEREATVRAAWLSYRAGRLDDALTYLARVKPPGRDRALDYFGELVRGQVLREHGALEPAVAAFRAALVAWPDAQSARVGLMMLLATHGDRREAAALAEAIQAETNPRIDPWWLYWQGDARLSSVFAVQLRELAR